MSTGKKRFWSDEEKRSICAQTQTSGVSVAQVARRYAMNANLIQKWLRDPRFAPDEAPPEAVATEFLPIEIEGAAPPSLLPQLPVPPTVSGAPLSAQRVDIALSDGRRISIEVTTAFSAELEPLAANIGKMVRAGPALFADDTPVNLQSKLKPKKTQTARLWSYVRNEGPWCGDARPCAWYQFSTDRKGNIRSTISLVIPAPCMPTAMLASMACSGQIKPMSRLAWCM